MQLKWEERINRWIYRKKERKKENYVKEEHHYFGAKDGEILCLCETEIERLRE